MSNPGALATMARINAQQQWQRSSQTSAPTAAQAPSRAANALTSTVPLLLSGVAAGVGGAAMAVRLCLPQHAAATSIVGIAGSFLLQRAVSTQGFDTPRHPASGTARILCVATGFALAGAATAGLANLVLRVYPPAAAVPALIGVGLGLLPMLLGVQSSPVAHTGVRRRLEQWAPTANIIKSTANWAFWLGTAASIGASLMFAPGTAVLAAASASLGIVRTGAHLLHFVGSQDVDALSPTEAALASQSHLALAALIGIFVGTRG